LLLIFYLILSLKVLGTGHPLMRFAAGRASLPGPGSPHPTDLSYASSLLSDKAFILLRNSL